MPTTNPMNRLPDTPRASGIKWIDDKTFRVGAEYKGTNGSRLEQYHGDGGAQQPRLQIGESYYVQPPHTHPTEALPKAEYFANANGPGNSVLDDVPGTVAALQDFLAEKLDRLRDAGVTLYAIDDPALRQPWLTELEQIAGEHFCGGPVRICASRYATPTKEVEWRFQNALIALQDLAERQEQPEFVLTSAREPNQATTDATGENRWIVQVLEATVARGDQESVIPWDGEPPVKGMVDRITVRAVFYEPYSGANGNLVYELAVLPTQDGESAVFTEAADEDSIARCMARARHYNAYLNWLEEQPENSDGDSLWDAERKARDIRDLMYRCENQARSIAAELKHPGSGLVARIVKNVLDANRFRIGALQEPGETDCELTTEDGKFRVSVTRVHN